MPIKVNYNGKEIVSPDDSTKAIVNCKGKLLEDNIVVDASEAHTKDSDTLVGLLERTLTEIEDDRVTEVGAYVFNGNSTIESISFPNATKAGFYCCYGAKNLTHANLPKATTIGSYCFADANLSYFDTPAMAIYSKTFRNNANLEHLFLRHSAAICTLGNVDAFAGTPFASGGMGGYVYVPRALIESYRSATNWSGLSCTWYAIEDYTVDGTITGDIDWKVVDGFAPFTIDGKRYYHPLLPWRYWCDHEENTDGFYIGADGYVMSPDGKYVYDNSGNKQTSNDFIGDGGEEYYTA